MLKKIALLLLLWLILIFYGGCMNIRIETDVDYPAGLFKEAQEKIERIHSLPMKKRGEPSHLNLMVYVGEERQLISFAVPFDLVEKALQEGDIPGEKEIDKYAEKIGKFDLDKIRKKQLFPGLILEAWVADEDVHILIWID